MKVDRLKTAVYRVPTEQPEADGTLAWTATTAVVVTAFSGDTVGTGWTYSTGAAADVVHDLLSDAVVGSAVDDVGACFEAMRRACRNVGVRGLVMQAISAVDIALWDLKARAHGLSLDSLFGAVRRDVAVYGSGGFTTMPDAALAAQVEEWHRIGCTAMKIKIGEAWGACEQRDLDRVRQFADHAGDDVELMVDANGGYTRDQARRIGGVLDDLGVVWFEEPVSSDDITGLSVVRDAVRCAVAAGEYISDQYEAARLCDVLDCLQLDATRCGGYTGFARGAAIAAAHNLPVSAHCAPAIHVPIAAATANLRHIEYFADHARLEPLLFDGVTEPRDGRLTPNGSPGHGYRVSTGAERYRI